MRKAFLLSLFIFIASIAPFSLVTQAEEVRVTPIKVTEQIYMLLGKGGNIGLFIGDEGTFLIDDQYAPLTPQIMAAIKEVGGETPRFLINTHFHGDHTGGNENFGDQGTLIVSHHNVRSRLAAGSVIKAFNMITEPVPKNGLPVITFSEDIEFHLNGDRVQAIHVPNAHTDGDSYIRFNTANVIHAGDIFFNGFYPFIDVDHGGTLKGMIAAVDRILAMTNAQTQIIPGHGRLASRSDLLAYQRMLGAADQRLSTLKAQGKTAAEAIATKPLADLEAAWGQGLFSGDRWIELIYPGVE